MRERFKKILAYITRSWKDEPGPTHSGLRILPPFVLELLAYLLLPSILYQVGAYLWSLK